MGRRENDAQSQHTARAADPVRKNPGYDLAARSRTYLAELRPTLEFLIAFSFLNLVVNVRFPGAEPRFWYLIPSVDIVLLFGCLAFFRELGWHLSRGVRIALVALLLVVRVFRLGDGLQQHYFEQNFNLYTDLPLAEEAIRFVHATLSGWQFWLLVLGLLAALAGLCFGISRSLTYAERYLAERRRICLFLGVSAASFVAVLVGRSDPKANRLFTAGFASSALPRLRHEARFLMNASGFQSDFERSTKRIERELREAPNNLSKLQGADVYLILIESYGETVFRRPNYVRETSQVLDAYESELTQRGFSMASGLLDSPTYGGHSWLAQATLATGIKTSDQLQYELLCASKPKPIASYFHEAGYHTVLAQPGTTRPWPRGDFFNFDRKYYAWNFEYAGPAFAWATMPDQYVLDFVRRRELDSHAGPLFVEFVLVSSHAPWSDQPALVDDWSTLEKGEIYRHLDITRYPVTWPNFEHASEPYIRSIIYDLEVLRRFIETFVNTGALIILVGDHQPVSEVNGNSASHGVPIHVLSRDARLLEPFLARGYARGMRPTLSQPHAGMDKFLANFLSDYSTLDPRHAP